jgi:hypothetical protein
VPLGVHPYLPLGRGRGERGTRFKCFEICWGAGEGARGKNNPRKEVRIKKPDPAAQELHSMGPHPAWRMQPKYLNLVGQLRDMKGGDAFWSGGYASFF